VIVSVNLDRARCGAKTCKGDICVPAALKLKLKSVGVQL